MVRPHSYREISKEEDELHRLTSSDSDYEPEVVSRREQQRGGTWDMKSRTFWATGSLCILAIISLVLIPSPLQSHPRDMLNYSPAAEVIKYKRVIYPDAAKHKTPFQGPPSPELDALWLSEYDLISRLPQSQASKLEIPSSEIPDDSGYYPVMLDIFHSLHCLNDIRMTLNPGYYGEPHVRANTTVERTKVHLDHCLEHLRLALWCGADVSPIPFQDLNGPYGLTAVHGYSHTCRDKDAILEWARTNQVKGMF